MTKEQLRIKELEAKAEDMRAIGCDKLADIMQYWAERLKEKQTA